MTLTSSPLPNGEVLPLAGRSARTPCAPAAARDDADLRLRARVLERLLREPRWDAGTSNVHVERGTVVLQGLVRNDAARLATRLAAEATPGVQRVWDARVRAREWQAMA